MKGLLIKDFRLMKGQVRTIAFVVAIAVLFGLPSGNYQFWLAYITIFAVTFCTSTISYDEFDKGYSYLFTLPISRKGYVREKYIFGLLLVTLSCGIGTLPTLLLQFALRPDDPFSPVELLVEVSAVWLLGFVALAFLLPTYLKFGAEKGRTAILLVYLCIGAVVFIPIFLAKKTGVDFSVLTQSLRRVPPAVWVAAALLALALLLAASMAVSCRIMERKEF